MKPNESGLMICLGDPSNGTPVSWGSPSFGVNDDPVSLTGRAHHTVKILEWKPVIYINSTGCPRLCMVQSFVSVDFSRPPHRFWRTSWRLFVRKLVGSSNMHD